jgi:hypothetical protein
VSPGQLDEKYSACRDSSPALELGDRSVAYGCR